MPQTIMTAVASGWTDERRRRHSEKRRGIRPDNTPARGFSYNQGYRNLSGQLDHPLYKGEVVAEHRIVLYNSIGPGPHECHWGCGKVLEWGGREGIQADHLNRDKLDNRPENLVPSCLVCNWQRNNRTLNKEAAQDIRDMHSRGMTQKSIAEFYGVNPSTVSRIVNGKRWADA
jgi:hypothetical protein